MRAARHAWYHVANGRDASDMNPECTPSEPEPPRGVPWDLPTASAPFALLDLEMTGLDPSTDRVIELCVRRERGGILEDELDTLIHPGTTCFGTSVHGIDHSMLESAPSFGQVADRVMELCCGAVIVAHGAPWDVAFLNAECMRAGKSAPFDFYLDTITLARRAVFAKSHSLAALASRFGIVQERPHRAGSDARALSEVFARLLEQLKPKSARDLWQVRVGRRQVRPEVLAACARLVESGEPAEIGYRPSHRPCRRIVAIVREIRTDLDPPRVMGYALPDRGRFELRADRILWAVAHQSPNPDGKAP
jgi:DNA polymerase III subunit epsilon